MSAERICEAYGEHQPYCPLFGQPLQTVEAVLVVELAGFPPLPNAARREGSWHQRAEDARTWRGAAFLAATQALREHPEPSDFPLRSAVVDYVVVTPTAQAPDPDGAVAAMKPVLDGIVDAGVLTTDSFKVIGRLSVRHETGPKSLRIEIVMGSR